MDNNNSKSQEQPDKIQPEQTIAQTSLKGDGKERESDKNSNNVMTQSKRIRKLSIEEVDLVKKYRKGREQNAIKVRQMRKSTLNLNDNFQAVKENMLKYLKNIEVLIEERCLEIDQKVDLHERACIIPEIEEIKNNYDSQKSVDEECFNEQLLENNLKDTHIEIIQKLSSCKQNISGDFDPLSNIKVNILQEYIQQINSCITKLHEYADNDESQLLKSLQCIKNINYLKMLQRLREKNYIKSDEIEQVMIDVERGDFTSNPFEDRAQQIGFNTTISAPHMHALTLEMLKDHTKESVKCLDIGIGSGWMTTALAHLMKSEHAICYGLDHIQGILNNAKKNIMKNHRNLLESGKIVLVKGDGREGLEDYAPFDIIHLGAAATLKAVNKFIHQLAPNGILCGPIIKDPYNQEFMIIKKNAEGVISKETILHVTYGSLVGVEEQYQENDEEEYYENEDDQISFQQQVIRVEKGSVNESNDDKQESNQHIREDDDEDDDDDDGNEDTILINSNSFFRSLLQSGIGNSNTILGRISSYQEAIRQLFNSTNTVIQRNTSDQSTHQSHSLISSSTNQSQNLQHQNTQESNLIDNQHEQQANLNQNNQSISNEIHQEESCEMQQEQNEENADQSNLQIGQPSAPLLQEEGQNSEVTNLNNNNNNNQDTTQSE